MNASAHTAETPGGSTRAGGGVVARVNGPLVQVTGLPGLSMNEVVALGEHGLTGEVVAILGDVATVQAYEYAGGLAPGDKAAALGVPLSAVLGPHLLGGVFDGLLRPLGDAGQWLVPDRSPAPQHRRSFEFTPELHDGDMAAPGVSLGGVANPGGVHYRVLVPPHVSGPVAGMRPAGRLAADDVVATVGGTAVQLTARWPIRMPRPTRGRLAGEAPLRTGQRVVDALFPVLVGGTCAVPGGFGTGKTVLLQQITKWCDADVIVYVGCGERGNELADMLGELAELSDPRTGGLLAQRTVVIANTSNMPMMAREASIYSGTAVAEHFRDMGLDVVVVADSTSRWAEALREFASRTGELPAEEGYPASLSSALAAFYERAGRVITLGGARGSITIIGAVSPAGGDLTEPVTTHTQRFVRCTWTLDRDLAYARHYPAVSWTGSFARDTDVIGTWHARTGDHGWQDRRVRIAALLSEADRVEVLAELMGITALPRRERVMILAGRLVRQGLLQQSALSATDAYCDQRRSAALATAVLDVANRCLELADRGVDPAAIEGLDFSPILRAKEDAATPDQVLAARDDMLARIARIEDGHD